LFLRAVHPVDVGRLGELGNLVYPAEQMSIRSERNRWIATWHNRMVLYGARLVLAAQTRHAPPPRRDSRANRTSCARVRTLAFSNSVCSVALMAPSVML